MAEFDAFSDTSFQLKNEGENIELVFKQGVPSTNQGTVQWNIPRPARGCQTKEGAYCGMLILLMEGSPLTINHRPTDGVFYTADPTANYDLHVGDKINGALVVGAFYEGEKKARGEDLTTTFTITDLKPNTSYYLIGHAVDCQGRYHLEGIKSYSSDYGNTNQPDTRAEQRIQFDCDPSQPLQLTDGTGLIPTEQYQFDIIIDDNFPNGKTGKIIHIDILGHQAGTYQDLVDEINRQLAIAENPVVSPNPPNTDQYFWDTVNQQLFIFDGFQHNKIDNLFYEPSDPSNVSAGTYWFNAENNTLKRWNIPTPTGWNDIAFITLDYDPIQPKCDQYWFNGTTFYQWSGNTWCEKNTLISIDDPITVPEFACNYFWYDTKNETLNKWIHNEQRWETKYAVSWDVPLNALPDNTYWFDESTNTLYTRNNNAWVDTNVILSTLQIDHSASTHWFNPQTEELHVWNSNTSEWELQPVMVWPTDPAHIESCTLWWDTTTDKLMQWDSINANWVEVDELVQSDISPCEPPIIPIDSVWYNPTTETGYRWDGGQWLEITFVFNLTVPNEPNDHTGWYNKKENKWFIWNTPQTGWNEINPIDASYDPISIPDGVLWMDYNTNSLFRRNNGFWNSIGFSTIPLTPLIDTQWYDSNDQKLKRWNGQLWEEVEPIAHIITDSNICNPCEWKLISRETGSSVVAFIAAPEGYSAGACVATGYADYSYDGNSAFRCTYTNNNGEKCYDVREIQPEQFLWNHVVPGAKILKPIAGTDGLSGISTYDELGIGDDGSADERRELADSIRAQLGYPVVAVELTKQQIDTAIQGALESFRKRSSRAYTRGYFFLDVNYGQQGYILTNKQYGYHKIVTVVSAHRMTAAFMSASTSAGIYGQLALQQLYANGTYDLTSFHLISQYIEQLEHLFATRLTFHFNEDTRLLTFYNRFGYNEKILLECSVERTEQQILKDRWCKSWIERYALSECLTQLSLIRGKYASLPGAGGGVSLNASELMTLAQTYREELISQIDDHIAGDPESWGMCDISIG